MKLRRAIATSKASRRFSALAPQAAATAALVLLSAASLFFVYRGGWTLYYGDADAHLMIARRLFDSQTPGADQIGSGWLPLLHFLIAPFARNTDWWRTGLAGAIPPALCFVAGASFFFAAVRRIFASTGASTAAAATATAIFALNPNVLYLQSIPMTEMVFFASLAAQLYFTVRYAQTQGLLCAAAAGIAACAGSLTRYDGWFTLPFVAAYFLIASKRRRPSLQWAAPLIFCAIACIGPLAWLYYNWWMTGDPIDFIRGPYSPSAIQGSATYPGLHDWPVAFAYFGAAVQLCAGPGLLIVGIGGIAVAVYRCIAWPLSRRIAWPLVLLALPALFYVASIHSGSIPIFVPTLWPHSYYNLRYGTAVLPLLALGAAALVAAIPPRVRAAAACAAILAGAGYWGMHTQPADWPVWQESNLNDLGRRERTRQAAEFLKEFYTPGTGIVTTAYPLTSVLREMGLPLREAMTIDNTMPWYAAVQRPEFFLTQKWAIVEGGDRVQSAINRLGRFGIKYKLEKRIVVGKQQVLEIYRR